MVEIRIVGKVFSRAVSGGLLGKYLWLHHLGIIWKITALGHLGLAAEPLSDGPRAPFGPGAGAFAGGPTSGECKMPAEGGSA